MTVFAEKVAIVTGGGSGIGEAVARRLGVLGVRVVVADIAVEAGERVVREIRRGGGEAMFRRTDVTDPVDVDGLVGFAVDTYGGLDFAHNNAGINHGPVRLHEMPLDDFDRVYAVNVRSVALCLRAELAYMVDHGGGSIVNTASGSGVTATPMQPAYSMSKHAVVGLTRSVGVDYAPLGVRVNAIAPGLVETPMTAPIGDDVRSVILATTPMGRMASAGEIAEAVVYLLSDESSYVTGAVLSIDGGLTAHN